MRTHRSSQLGAHRGFTLIESIAAIIILAVAVPPMLWAIKEGHSQRVNPMLASKARWLVTEKLEAIIADRHSITRGYSYLTSANYSAENPVSGYPAFSRSVSFSETEADLITPGVGYKRVTVTVSWSDVTATPRSLAVSTVVTEY